MSLLYDIVAAKKRALRDLRARPRQRSTRTPLDVLTVLRRPAGAPLRLLAEVKLRSPSAGALSRVLAPGDRALVYAEAGAAMVSVLCDAPFFDGAWEHLSEARARLDQGGRPVPLLAKEFVLDERQIEEARDRGADAVLLIARIVEGPRLAELAHAARAEGLEPLFEVVDEREVDASLAAGGRLLGVNARDLDTLAVDAARAARLLAALPEGVCALHLSGVRDAADVSRLARSPADGALVGEALMRQDDPRRVLRSLCDAARGRASPFEGER